MNTENLLAVADAIEHASIPDLGFNMRDYRVDSGDFSAANDMTGRQCGTVACIAGWAAAIDRGGLPTDGRYILSAAMNFLDLPEGEAAQLFAPPGHSARWLDIQPAQAVAVLRHAAATGEIDWARVLEPTEVEA